VQSLEISKLQIIVKGGISEECLRMFVLTRFEKVFQKTDLVATLNTSSIVIGVGHAYAVFDILAVAGGALMNSGHFY
jgi:hypothetical protein